MPGSRKVLVIGLSRDEYARLLPLLERKSFTVDRFPGARRALDLVGTVALDLLLVRYPLADLEAGEFLAAVRRETCASRHAPLVLLADEADAKPAGELVGHGANRVLSLAAGERELQAALAGLLEVAPRQAARIPVRIEIQLARDVEITIGETANLSSTGVLVHTPQPIPRGTWLRFEFMVGQRPVVGMAEVVRHTRPEIEGDNGAGLRFLSFEGDSRARFERYLDDLQRFRGKAGHEPSGPTRSRLSPGRPLR